MILEDVENAVRGGKRRSLVAVFSFFAQSEVGRHAAGESERLVHGEETRGSHHKKYLRTQSRIKRPICRACKTVISAI